MTKIDIISGFLGAGKTTFIKKMIEEAFVGEKLVLIENEFGEVGIDGGFLKDSGIDTDLTKFILDQDYFLACNCFFQKLLYKCCFSGSEETGDNINFCHNDTSFLPSARHFCIPVHIHRLSFLCRSNLLPHFHFRYQLLTLTHFPPKSSTAAPGRCPESGRNTRIFLI